MPSTSRGQLLSHVLLLLRPLLLYGSPGLEPVRPETNRCSDPVFTEHSFNKHCGAPLSSPCFNSTRCSRSPLGSEETDASSVHSSWTGGAESSGPRIYVFDNDCSLSDSASISLDAVDKEGEALRNEPLSEHLLSWVFRDAAQQAGVLAATYESACMFIHVSWGEKEPCAVNTPLWDNGSNHVMVNFGDHGR